MPDYQPFPTPGRIRLDVDLDELKDLCADTHGPATLYSYVMTSVELNDGRFVQKGSAPNWQGDRVTLCTCKHWMRTFLSYESWPGVWVAGFTGRSRHDLVHNLVYLMRVGRAFDSHLDMWRCSDLPKDMKRAKAAHLNKFGDLFRPESPSLGSDDRLRYEPGSYKPPIDGHPHQDGWNDDIRYFGCGERPAALLVGDPQYTFIWQAPFVYIQRQLFRGQKKWTLHDLMSQLKQDDR